MGRLTGLVGGFVITTGAIYLTVFQHHRNTLTATRSLRESSALLESMLQPLPTPKPRVDYREVRAGTVETMKDMWNDDVEVVAKWVQNVDGSRMARLIEDGARNGFKKLRGVVEEQTRSENVVEKGVREVKEGVREVKEMVRG